MAYRILLLLLLAGPLWAADAPRNLVNTESPVSARCVAPDGLTYESCGGSGGGGSGGLTNTELRATPVPVSGTVTASGPLTDTELRATAVPISGTVTASGPLTDAQLRATPVPVSGTVTASGPLTDTQLRATAVPISGALTDAELRATAVPVSGTVTASGPVTDAQLRATPVPVSGTVTVTDGVGALNVIVDSSALPAGAATAANQDGIVKDGTGDTTQANVTTGRLHVDGSGVTQPVSGTVTANAGTNLNTSALNLEATQADIKTAIQLIDDDQTGASVNYRTSAGATEDETEIKATAGRLFSINVTNTNAAARYIRCYNLTAANTTPGTSTVFLGLAIPGATTGAGFTTNFGPTGIAFSTALTCTLTTGAADSDVAEVAANEIKWLIVYK